MTELAINLDETFETLSKAPIVEAVIDIHAVPAERPGEDALRDSVQNRFRDDYQFADSLREIRQQVTITPNQLSNQTVQDLGWKGLRFRSTDKKYIAQFNRDGFALSRLEPYESWKALLDETLRLWNVYIEIVRPLQIDRLGLRYINRIQLPPNELQFENYLKVSPSTPEDLNLPISGFMHQDAVVVPSYPYAINIIRTIQPPNPSAGGGLSLILDIDTIMTIPFELQESALRRHLAEMRWLKNKVFFGTVTEKSLERFR